MARRPAATNNAIKLAGHIVRPPMETDGFPLSYQEAFEITVQPVDAEGIRKALVDSEMITSLLREHPKEMASIVNHVLAGRSDLAREEASRIGLTEEAFQQSGGGMLWWIVIGVVGGMIFAAAATHRP